MATDDNRTELQKIALSLFTERGYDAVGVQEIAETAGVTKPTLYHYFGNKSGLLTTLLDENIPGMNSVFDIARAYSHDITSTLTQIVSAYFIYARNNPLFYRLLLSLWFAPVQSEAYLSVHKYMEKQHQSLEELFLHAAEDHGNMRDRHRAYSATFLGMVNTYIGMALNNYIQLDDELCRQAVHQFMHGIFS